MIYGYNQVTGKEISCDRTQSTVSHNCGVFGTYGTGKTVFLQKEIAHILNESNDRVFIIDIDCEYNRYTALCSDFMVKVSDESDIVIPCDKQLTIFSFTAMPPKKLRSCYKACLESIWQHIQKHQDCYSWIYLEVIEVLFQSDGGAALLADIAEETKTHNCSLTFTSAAFEEIYENSSGKMLLENTDFVVHFTQLQRSRKCIQSCYHIDDTLLHFLTDQLAGTGVIKTCNGKAFEPFSCRSGSSVSWKDVLSLEDEEMVVNSHGKSKN